MRRPNCQLAFVALLPVLTHGLGPATNDNNWIYRGCYSDKPYSAEESLSGSARAVFPGVPDFPRTLNGLFTRTLPHDDGSNGGQQCRSLCAAHQFRFAGTNHDQCWCDNAIAVNGTSATTPKFGLPDEDDSSCQTPCVGNTEEACGNNSGVGDSQRLSVYEMQLLHSTPYFSPVPTTEDSKQAPHPTIMNDYPRPDFLRKDLAWESLDGPWSFLFDDNDVGVAQRWHAKGIPDEITVDLPNPDTGDDSIAHSITAKIAAGTQELLQNNTFKKSATVHKKRQIQVPYVFQCPASGIHEQGVHEVLWYEREIRDVRTEEQKAAGYHLILRFGAVDYEAKVWVDGHLYGGHCGGHVPFDIDITDAFVDMKARRLTIRVFDSAHDLTQPRGKQYWKAQPESIFYTPSGGIWQSVWLESVPGVSIGDSSAGTLLRSNDIENGTLHADIKILNRAVGHKFTVEIEASLAGIPVATERADLPRDSDTASLAVPMRLSSSQKDQVLDSGNSIEASPSDNVWLQNLALWSPEHPTLYDLTIRLFSSAAPTTPLDTVHTTTGMRSLSWSDSTIRLNNRPYFQALFLDQGYWPTTFLTPPSSSALRHDIQLSKAMGFNGCRKHQKLEDPRFLYWADRMGFLVWSEMANAYAFSETYTQRFDAEWRAAVLRDRNHPSVVAWTPVNESWAYTDLPVSKPQRDHIRSLYYATKALDQTRPINDNCGWQHVKNDLTTFHDYSDAEALGRTCATLDGILAPKAGRSMFLAPLQAAEGESGLGDQGSQHESGAPIICTEFGGVNIARGGATATAATADPIPNDANSSTCGDRDWGYTTAANAGDLLQRLEAMMMGIVDGGHIAGFVYTQLTDIEQEVNGLYTPDRRAKLDPTQVRAIVERVRSRFAGLHGGGEAGVDGGVNGGVGVGG